MVHQTTDPTDAPGRTLTATQVAAMLGENPRTVQRWCSRGDLPAFRSPGRKCWRVQIAALKERWGDRYALDEEAPVTEDED